MDIITIPKVGLVDATTRSIGVYSEDPSWWQQLKKGHDGNEEEKKSDDLISETGSQALLIKNKDQQQTKAVVKVERAKKSTKEKKKECSVIGETPLHIAIIYDDLITIKNLVENKGVDVNQRCVDGKFTSGFQSKQTTSLIAQSKYNSLAYFGEYPLAFAACFASKEVYDYLIEKGADPNMQGLSFTILQSHK